MNYQEFEQFAGGLASFATVIALVVGGVWTYQRFIRNREAYPIIEFTVNVAFVFQQEDYWVAEALAFLENKGLVRHDISTFSFDIRYFKKGDPVEARDDFYVFVPHDGGDGTWLPKGWGATYIEPGLLTRYSSLIKIPVEATAVLIHGKFIYSKNDWHTADKLVPVPTSAHQVAQADGAASAA